MTAFPHSASQTPAVHECPDCGGSATSTLQTQTFPYKHGDQTVELPIAAEVFACTTCGFQWTDSDAEVARHDAVCRYLGVLTPGDVRRGRQQAGLTQVQLAQLTGIGEASIKRWESGSLIQNRSHDLLLRLAFQGEGLRLMQAIRVESPHR